MIQPTHPSDLHWIILCLATESDRPDEWPPIAQTIENRRLSGRWGHTYRDVVLARKQFSAFNEFTVLSRARITERSIFENAARALRDSVRLIEAAIYVRTVDTNHDTRAGSRGGTFDPRISPTTLHYYSPVSMKPPGSAPIWAAVDESGKPLHATRLYTPDGIDKNRFVFAEGVA